jgi:hypothetical protein
MRWRRYGSTERAALAKALLRKAFSFTREEQARGQWLPKSEKSQPDSAVRDSMAGGEQADLETTT